jgi:hypothetical protein
MPHGRNTRRLAWLLVLVGLLASFPELWNRAQREQANIGVDLVLEMTSFQTLALQDGEPIATLLAKMKQNGATGLAVAEMNVNDLADRGYAVVKTGSELQVLGALSGDAFLSRLVKSGQLERNATYIVPLDPAVTERLRHDLALRFAPDRLDYLPPRSGETGQGAFVLRYPAGKLKDYGVGFDPADFALADSAGLRPVPRPRPAPGATPESVRQIWADLAKMAPRADSVMFYGDEVIGYRPDSNEGLLATAAAINRLGWTVDLIEHMSQLSYVEQRGYQLVAEATNYRVARVFSMGQEWQNKEVPSNVVNMWARAVPERNIRVLFIRPFFGNLAPGQTATAATTQTLAATARELAKQGFVPGAPGYFRPYQVPWLMRGLMGLAVVGAALLWLGLFVELQERFWVPLGLAGALLSIIACYVAPNTGATLVSMGAAVLFPTLGVTWLMARWRLNAQADEANLPTTEPGARTFGALVGKVVAGLLTFFGFCLVGGLLVAASLGDIQHMLEFAFFRGVKLVFIVPMLLVLVSYVLLGRTGSLVQTGRFLAAKVEGILDRTIRYRDVAIAMVVGLAVVYYITRSGNFPILPVSSLELKMRTALEQLLFARPRNKEFLIAYPALILAATLLWSGWRRWVWVLLVAATTGAVSVVNSFEHLRTPWLMSLLRGVNGLWVGALVGTIATAVLYLLVKVALRFRQADRSL